MSLFDAKDMISDIIGAAVGMYVMWIAAVIVGYLAWYILNGYRLMCTGRKAKIDGDFMPFIPVARQIYQMKIADCPVWYIFFFESTLITRLCKLVIAWVLWLLLKSRAVPMITVLVFIYSAAGIVITFFYYRKFYYRFGFNPNAAWLHAISILGIPGIVAVAFDYLIAFSNAIVFMGNKKEREGRIPTPAAKGVIVGVSGSYANASFDIENGAELSFGRDPQSVNIVLGATDSDVSRRHCKVSFDARTNQYAVTDLGSSTGTYLENGTRLTPEQTQYVARGSVIYLGSTKKNAFRLN